MGGPNSRSIFFSNVPKMGKLFECEELKTTPQTFDGFIVKLINFIFSAIYIYWMGKSYFPINAREPLKESANLFINTLCLTHTVCLNRILKSIFE